MTRISEVNVCPWWLNSAIITVMSDEDVDDVDERLEEIERLARKNNSMLRSMHSAQRRGVIFRLFHWAVIIVLAVIAYLYIEPYIERFEELYSTAKEASVEAGRALDSLPVDI